MHKYNVLHHDRKNVYFLIGAVSIFLAGVFASFFPFLISPLVKITASWVDISCMSTYGVVIAAPSGFTIFGLLFLFFDRYVWCWPFLYRIGLVTIPNLNGSWTAKIVSFTKENPLSAQANIAIQADIAIEQTYSKISIRLKTELSKSFSKMATFEMVDSTCFNLRYEYFTEYMHDAMTGIKRHYGVTALTLESPDHNFLTQKHSATYYTEQVRDSNGKITFQPKGETPANKGATSEAKTP